MSGNPKPRINGRRAFRGQLQLTAYEQKILGQVEASYLQVTFSNGEPVFSVQGETIRRDTAERLIHYGHVMPRDGGLFAGSLAQTYRARR